MSPGPVDARMAALIIQGQVREMDAEFGAACTHRSPEEVLVGALGGRFALLGTGAGDVWRGRDSEQERAILVKAGPLWAATSVLTEEVSRFPGSNSRRTWESLTGTERTSRVLSALQGVFVAGYGPDGLLESLAVTVGDLAVGAYVGSHLLIARTVLALDPATLSPEEGARLAQVRCLLALGGLDLLGEMLRARAASG